MKYICLTLLNILAITQFGCSSQKAATTSQSAATASDSAPQAAVTPVNVNPAPDSSVMPITPATNMNVNSAGVVLQSGRKLTESNSNIAIKNAAMPAPDNSEMSVSMDKDGRVVETRVFRNHPQLLKAVRTWLGVKEKKIEVYLKNGKVATLTGDKLENFNAVSASTILEAAGIKPVETAPVNKRTENKKTKN